MYGYHRNGFEGSNQVQILLGSTHLVSATTFILTNPKSKFKVQVQVKNYELVFIKFRLSNQPAPQWTGKFSKKQDKATCQKYKLLVYIRRL